MTKAEFLALTPAEWFRLVEVWTQEQERQQEREDRLLARLLCCVNWMMVPRKEGDPRPTEEDYMPRPVGTEEENEIQQTERLRQQFLAATARNQHEGL